MDTVLYYHSKSEGIPQLNTAATATALLEVLGDSNCRPSKDGERFEPKYLENTLDA